MTDNEWGEWAHYHATLFGLTSEADVEMMRLWRPLLADCTKEELMEATSWLAKHDAGRWRTQHADRLYQRVSEQRMRRQRATIEAMRPKDDDKLCPKCRGTGAVTVPHPRCVVDGVWLPPHYEAVVSCYCGRGTALFNHIWAASQMPDDGKRRTRVYPIMRLESYELSVPSWAELKDQRAEHIRRSMRAKEAALEAHAAAEGKPIDIGKVRQKLKQIGRMD